jgi:hypothetical protein
MRTPSSRYVGLASAVGVALALASCGGGSSHVVSGGGGPPPPPPPSSNAKLSALVVSAGEIQPTFDPDTHLYFVPPAFLETLTTVTATTQDPGATLEAEVGSGGFTQTLTSGVESTPFPLSSTSGGIRVTVTAADGVTDEDYLVEILLNVPTTPEVYVKASNTGSLDTFGTSVAISGNTVAVGAPFEASGASGIDGDQSDDSKGGAGAVYVFVKTDGEWSQQAYVKASNPDVGDWFGNAVALDGDTLVVGAPFESSPSTGIDGPQGNGAASSGAVYVFVRTGTTWSQQAYIKASNTDAGDLFGTSVDLDGDTLVVGATGEASLAAGVNGDQSNDLAAGAGAVYVFTRSGTTWTQQAYVKASNTQGSDRFGASVSVSRDFLAVGAPDEDSDAEGINGNQVSDLSPSSGAVYVFSRTGTEWEQSAYVKASNTGPGDQFGLAVGIVSKALVFDTISFSLNTLVVGAPHESSNAQGIGGVQDNDLSPNSGAAYVFTSTSFFGLAIWEQDEYVKASNAQAQDLFGSSVAVVHGRFLVGATMEDSDAGGVNGDETNDLAVDSGALYTFVEDSGWTQDGYVKATNARTGDQFGFSCAIDFGTIVVGALLQDGLATGIDGNQSLIGAPDSGAAYILP